MTAEAPKRGNTRYLPDVLQRFLRPDFYFVNIGANDGVSNDPIFPFIQQYGWRGLAVEPLRHVFEELQRNYAGFPGVAVEHAAITATPRPLHFVAPEATDAEWIRQSGSLDLGYVEKTIALMRYWKFQGEVRDDLERFIQRVEVPCLTFDALLAKHAVQRIDFLNIDAENSDFEILGMIDFTRWRPGILCLETSEFTEAQAPQVAAMLAAAGYEFLEPFDLFSQIYVQGAGR